MAGPLAVLILVLLATLGVTVAQRVPAPVRKEFAPPPLDLKTQTLLYASSSFLYTGSKAVQAGVAPGTIEERRVAVVRGRVVNRLGKGMEKVLVRIDQHPEYGSTETREDGWFDMAVNGGGPLVVSYEKVGYIPVQRRAKPVWQETEVLAEVVLTALDPVVTQVNLAQTTQPIVVAAGSPQRDADGLRTARLLFASGTLANLRMPNGTTQPITNLAVRATEFTVGPRGKAAMPADLPDTSAYTYAVDFAVDQATQAGASAVEFSQPVIHYVENFIGFSVGTPVPCGSFDRSKQAWVPEPNGLVIRIVSVTGGLANVDVTGSGLASTAAQLSAVGITNNERATLATLYQPGASLWRVPVTHFSSYDLNWGIGLPTGATEPNGGPEPNDDDAPEDSTSCGSIIGMDAQTLGEELSLVGIPYKLRYQSDRTPGAVYKNSISVQLSGATVDPSLLAIKLSWLVAGQRHERTFPPAPNQRYTIQWDGKDAYGRLVQGGQFCHVALGNEYAAVYRPTEGFARVAVALPSMPTWTVSPNARGTQTLYKQFTVDIGAWSAAVSSTRLGGWTLDAHHSYQPLTRRLELGTGEHLAQGPLSMKQVTTLPVSVTGTAGCLGMVVAPDGTIYYATGGGVLKVTPDGVRTLIAGGGNPVDHIGDGLPATQAYMLSSAVALDRDGNLFIADGATHRIRRVGSDGIIRTVAGSGNQGWDGTRFLGAFSGDGGPATQARLNTPMGLAVTPDGDIYFCDQSNNRIRKVDASGTIRTVAGSNQTSLNVPPLAINSSFFAPRALVLCPQGGYFFSTDRVVLRVTAEGGIKIVAGGLTPGYGGDGGPAVQALLAQPGGLLALASGDLLIADTNNHRVRLVSQAAGSGAIGPINTIFGTGSTCIGSQLPCGDQGNAELAPVTLPRGLGMASDRTLYVGENGGRIRILTESLPGLTFGEHQLPSSDGSEVYVFDAGGRHLRTRHGLTGATKLTFNYDAGGYLLSIVDAYNNTTSIQRASGGTPMSITSPYGQVTTFQTGGDYLTKITDPAGGEWNCLYDGFGLLQAFADPNGHVAMFEYTNGRLSRDTDAAGGYKTLSQTTFRTVAGAFGVNEGTTVTMTTALGRTSTYRREIATGQFGGGAAPPGVMRRTNTSSTGSREIIDLYPTGKVVQTKPDGTRITTEVEPGPRWGLVAPVTTFREVRTPAGLVGTTVAPVPVVTLATPSDPFSVLNITSSEVVNGRSTTTQYVYNPGANTRTVTITSPAGRVRVQTFDDQGRLLTDRVGSLATTTNTYDSRGRLATISRSDGATSRQVTLAYDARGFLASLVDPLGQTTSFQYDAAGSLTVQTLPDGTQVQTARDARGNNISLQPPGGLPHFFEYSEVDLVTRYVPPSLGPGSWSTLHEYSADKQLTRTTRPGGDTVDYVYNPSGLVSNVLHATGAQAITYDLLSSCCMGGGRVASITRQDTGQAQANGLAFTYDGPLTTSMVATGAQPGAVSWTYNNDLLRASESVNGANTVSYSYDADRLMIGAGAETLVRHAQNGLVTGTSIGAFASSRSYNAFGELTGLSYSWNGASLASFSYIRDALGRITRATETLQGLTAVLEYSYDLRGRLTQVLENGLPRANYTYDANGNRLLRSGPSGTSMGAYDAQDRMVSYGASTFTYTRAGELETATVNGQTTIYTYDALGALVQVTLPGGGILRFEHVGSWMQVVRKLNNAMTGGMVYASDLTPAASTDAQGGVVARFVYSISNTGAPDYMTDAGGPMAFVRDHLGSPRLVVRVASGLVMQAMNYDEYGIVISDSQPGFQPFGFAGGIYDASTGLVRFGWRDYDAAIGRWTAKDPLLFAGGDHNIYAYCRNDPVNHVDPSGLECEAETNAYGAAAIRAQAAYDYAAYMARFERAAQQVYEGGFTDTALGLASKDYSGLATTLGHAVVLERAKEASAAAEQAWLEADSIAQEKLQELRDCLRKSKKDKKEKEKCPPGGGYSSS